MAQYTKFGDLLNLDFNEPGAHVSYGEDQFQYAEGWIRPENVNTLLMIHGGCWLADYDADHIRPFCSAIWDMGINVWSLEYRRIGNSGGGWPGTFEDILAGIRAVYQQGRQRSEDIGGQKFIIAGHSAGGHLALWASTRFRSTPQDATENDAVLIDHTIGLAAISDLQRYAAGNSPCEKSTIALLGGTPQEQPRRYAEASPLSVKSDNTITLFHGIEDSIVPLAHSRKFASMTDARLVALPDTAHFDLVDPQASAFTAIAKVLQSF